MKRQHICIYHHLGLGDHIICNGLIRFLSKTYDNISLLYKRHNKKAVECMYSDLKNINTLEIRNDMEAEIITTQESVCVRLGIVLNQNFPTSMNWAEVFYYQIGVPYEYSWQYFHYNKPIHQNTIPLEPYVFLCNSGSDGIDGLDYSKINTNLKKIYSNNGEFFDNIDLIQHAAEIHCINSAYIHLIDRININSTTKLFYHKNFKLKPFSNFTLKKEWIIV